jgi:hypothetical protein
MLFRKHVPLYFNSVVTSFAELLDSHYFGGAVATPEPHNNDAAPAILNGIYRVHKNK